MQIHRFDSIEEANKALAEFEENNEFFVKSVKTSVKGKSEVVFIITSKNKAKTTKWSPNEYNPREY